MSTPTTAVATLPHYHHAHGHAHLHHSHHHAHQGHHPSSATTNYRSTAANSLLHQSNSSVPASSSSSSTARLLPFYQSGSHTVGYSSSDGTTQNHPPQSPPAPPPHGGHYIHRSHIEASTPTTPRLHTDHNYSSASTLASAKTTATATAAAGHGTDDHHPSRKRRRSREPDWNSFYQNGLPKEIIVIDDSPDPEASAGRTLISDTIGHTSAGAVSYEKNGTTRHPAKRRRRDDAAPGYHVQYVGSHTNTPLQNATPNGSTLSSDRTNSVHNTTAPTSLSSNSQYEDASAPLKRKRTTRQQVANEAKRQDIDGLGGPFLTYKPPPLPPKKVAEVDVRVVHDHYTTKNVKVDDDDGHYIVVPDADLTEKYKITRLLGQGTFGKVVQARDRKRNEAVAVKIIRSVQKYRDASRIELRVLATLKANDHDNRNRCIHLRDTFDYRGHICIVMDLLGQSVFDFLKGNGFVPFPNSHIQNFARQLFTSVAFLHDLNLIHTDLKPENILLRDDIYQTYTYNRKIPSSSTTISRQASQRRVLLNTEIRLIDFGSATFQDEYHSSVVSTRHYRAPEIILGLGWSFPCDIWSIGCILVEFFTGDALFQTHDNLEHLAMMEAVVGSRIDSHLVQAVNKMSTRSGGNPASKYFKRLKLDYPTPDTTRGSRRFVKAMKRLEDIFPANNQFFKHLLCLLRKIFVYDPAQRITAKQALNHPWFKEIAQPDDGIHAAKIRLERKRSEQENARHPHFVG
ncbi:serine threonine protein kinase CMGC group [Conoideocrella luteorostrata]|uniref:dual-specificity kinase n=1 Tax=Conoideocrella luteorostrata TaxID=1105319 RepID=A0AAJ0CZJ3_9HYPO|nr:serine threonine protein kinase CMGC group [Conoideocrella luteorostrata]